MDPPDADAQSQACTSLVWAIVPSCLGYPACTSVLPLPNEEAVYHGGHERNVLTHLLENQVELNLRF
jgi:hypothetical protein